MSEPLTGAAISRVRPRGQPPGLAHGQPGGVTGVLLLIRPAVAADADPIATVFLAARRAGMPWLRSDAATRWWVRTSVLTTGTIWVAEEAEQVVGFAGVCGDVLAHLYVHPDAVAATSLPARHLEAAAPARLEALSRSSPRPVFNLTGHCAAHQTSAVRCWIEATLNAMRSPVALKYDLETRRRGERDDHVRELIRELTGAEDATIVNNNSAAVLNAERPGA